MGGRVGGFRGNKETAPVLQYGVLLADGWVVQGHISHSPLPPKKVAGLAMDVERLVYGLPCRS